VVVGDIAYARRDPEACISAAPDVRVCNTERSYADLAEHNAMEQRVATETGAGYVSVIPWMCTDSLCPPIIAGYRVHKDAQHIADNFALWLRGALGESAGLLP
jgi:hypothetical protein